MPYVPCGRMCIQSTPAPTAWKGSSAGMGWTAMGNRHAASKHNYVPTLEQRLRVFEVMSTLTGYHTRQVGQTAKLHCASSS